MDHRVQGCALKSWSLSPTLFSYMTFEFLRLLS